MVPLLAVLNCAALLRNSPAPRSACLRCSVAAPPATTAEAAPPSLYPAWPLALSEKPELQDVIDAFEETSTAVPLRAAFEEGDGWRVWSDGGFAIQKFLAAKAMSRASYPAILACLRGMMVQSQAKYPDLYAVLKFVPKKNGLNPLLAQIDEGADASAVALDGLRPREARRRIEDAQRTLEQSWLLLHAYLTLPSSKHREDLLWAARTVVEKVKSDQRTRAIELLALGVFDRRASLYELVGGGDAPWSATPLRVGFERNFGVDAWHPKPTNSRMVWQRSRMVYPFLEVAHRAWLRASGHEEQDEEDEAAIADILDRIARAGPEEKVLNSLLYWLLDLCYKVMGKGESIPAWAPEPYLLRRDGVEGRMVEELEGLGHLLQLLGQCAERSEEGLCIVSYDGEDEEGVSFGRHAARGDQLLLEVKEVVATSTLLASIRDSCADACPTVLNDYLMALRSPSLTLERIEELELESIASLLDVDTELVIEREETVRAAMSEWRNPELLFRYLDANRNDAKMYPLIKRWMRAIFGLSDETLRMIRRESAENIRHLVQIPQDVLLRWYSEACPGTSKCKTLFMLGEDAGSCLRVISNEGNKFNRALMGYVLQSHVRALVVVDTAGRVMVRSLIRLLLRSDTLTPVIFCDPMFFTLGYSRELQRELLVQARMLEEHMGGIA